MNMLMRIRCPLNHPGTLMDYAGLSGVHQEGLPEGSINRWRVGAGNQPSADGKTSGWTPFVSAVHCAHPSSLSPCCSHSDRDRDGTCTYQGNACARAHFFLVFGTRAHQDGNPTKPFATDFAALPERSGNNRVRRGGGGGGASIPACGIFARHTAWHWYLNRTTSCERTVPQALRPAASACLTSLRRERASGRQDRALAPALDGRF